MTKVMMTMGMTKYDDDDDGKNSETDRSLAQKWSRKHIAGYLMGHSIFMGHQEYNKKKHLIIRYLSLSLSSLS